MFLAFAMTLALAFGTASAQIPMDPNCTIGAYADQEGTIGVVTAVRDLGNPLATFVFYTVLLAPDTFLNAAAWDFDVNMNEGQLWFERQQDREIFGTFLEDSSTGFRLGIGSIVNGQVPVTLMCQTIQFIDNFQSSEKGIVSILANSKESSEYATYNSAQNVVTACAGGYSFLIVDGVIANEAESWGKVKALYHNN
jgi:hypothetical protein